MTNSEWQMPLNSSPGDAAENLSGVIYHLAGLFYFTDRWSGLKYGQVKSVHKGVVEDGRENKKEAC
jgi:hypothetical protein